MYTEYLLNAIRKFLSAYQLERARAGIDLADIKARLHAIVDEILGE